MSVSISVGIGTEISAWRRTWNDRELQADVLFVRVGDAQIVMDVEQALALRDALTGTLVDDEAGKLAAAPRQPVYAAADVTL